MLSLSVWTLGEIVAVALALTMVLNGLSPADQGVTAQDVSFVVAVSAAAVLCVRRIWLRVRPLRGDVEHQ